jgi:hypothetical protein
VVLRCGRVWLCCDVIVVLYCTTIDMDGSVPYVTRSCTVTLSCTVTQYCTTIVMDGSGSVPYVTQSCTVTLYCNVNIMYHRVLNRNCFY